jgi:chromosome segregation ATPase
MRVVSLALLVAGASAAIAAPTDMTGIIKLLKDEKAALLKRSGENENGCTQFDNLKNSDLQQEKRDHAQHKEDLEQLKTDLIKYTETYDEQKQLEADMLDAVNELKRSQESSTAQHTDQLKEQQALEKELQGTVDGFDTGMKALQMGGSCNAGKVDRKTLLQEGASPNPGAKNVHGDLHKSQRGDICSKLEELKQKAQSHLDEVKAQLATLTSNNVALIDMQGKAEKNKQDKQDAAKKAKDDAKKGMDDTEKAIGTKEDDIEKSEKAISDLNDEITKNQNDCSKYQEDATNTVGLLDQGIQTLSRYLGLDLRTARKTDKDGNVVFLQTPSLEQSVTHLRSLHNSDMSEVADLLVELDRQEQSPVPLRGGRSTLTGAMKQIVTMIDDLVERLHKDKTALKEHKKWCDAEIEKTDLDKKDTEKNIKAKDALKGDKEKQIKAKAKDIKDAKKRIADIADELEKALDLRRTRKDDADKTVHDAKQAQFALTQAIEVLSKHEGKSESTGTGLKADASGKIATGITDLLKKLEDIKEDYVKMQGDIEKLEKQELDSYETDKTTKETESAGKTATVETLETQVAKHETTVQKLASALEQLNDSNDKLAQYQEELKKPCGDHLDPKNTIETDFKKKIGDIDQEIKALQEAQKTLREEAINMQKTHSKGLKDMESLKENQAKCGKGEVYDTKTKACKKVS